MAMGVGRILFRGEAVGDFPKNFSRGAKSGEICFLPVKDEKTIFFCPNFQNPKGSEAPPNPPSEAHGHGLLLKTSF